MSTKAAGIPRCRPFHGPALLRHGFRPFFLGAGVWALTAMLLWIGGFVAAAVAGFLLTAIPNWTGRMPLQGIPLGLLFAVWLAGRLAMYGSAWIGAAVAAALDLSFLGLLLGVVLREILAGRNWRNLPMPIALAGLLAANALTHADEVGIAATGPLGQRLGIGIAILLIGLIGGRVIPSFTQNWLKKRGDTRLPARFGALDRIALALLLAALAAWVIAPDGRTTGAALIAAAIATAIRLARWQGHRTLAEPLVWSLHLGFVWVPIGLLMLGLASFLPDLPRSAGLHALTAGAMTGMPLAVMTRATLGHTSRPLTSDRWSAAIYLLAAAAAAFRIAAACSSAEAYLPLLWAAGLAWIAAFGIFDARYGRILVSR